MYEPFKAGESFVEETTKICLTQRVCVCVRACGCAHTSGCAHICVCACEHVCVCMCVCVYWFIYLHIIEFILVFSYSWTGCPQANWQETWTYSLKVKGAGPEWVAFFEMKLVSLCYVLSDEEMASYMQGMSLYWLTHELTRLTL